MKAIWVELKGFGVKLGGFLVEFGVELRDICGEIRDIWPEIGILGGIKWLWGEIKLILGKIQWEFVQNLPQPSPVPLFPFLRVPSCFPISPCRLGSTVGTMSTTTTCQGPAHPRCRASVAAATWGSRGAGLSVLTTSRPLRDPLRPLTPHQRPLRPPGVPWLPTRPPQYPPTLPGPQRSGCMSAGCE